MAGSGAEVDDPVGVNHHGLMVLNDDDGAAAVHEAIQEQQHGLDVGRVQSDSRLIEHDDAAFLAQVDGELEALMLTTGQGGQGLAEVEVTEPHILQP